MRVALVTENFLPKLDGVTRTLAMLLEHLQRRGHQAIVLAPEGAPRRYARARVFSARGVPLPLYPELRLLFPSPRLERRVASFRPDIVHVADPVLLGAAGVLWAQRLGTPVVASYHTNLAAYCSYYHLSALAELTWTYRRFIHNQCVATVAPSPSTASVLTRKGFERVSVWPRGVDPALFTPQRRSSAWRARIAGDPDKPILLYAGRLAHEKNLAILRPLISRLEAYKAHLVFVGDGPARADLESAFKSDSVTFMGYLRGTDLAEAYASADVFVFPSLTETFGQVVLEAMASGLSVVAFDTEGVRDLVRHSETGFLLPPAAPASFISTVGQLLDYPELRVSLGARARQEAAQRTWAAVMDGLLAHYRDAISTHEQRSVA
ncbi:MAG TPA: glycosyltransferase family 1 protein [Ktedonobacterales bacterium]|nr:glycosyltransferase family 1 protein [Ktedonobacterales bacterium]